MTPVRLQAGAWVSSRPVDATRDVARKYALLVAACDEVIRLLDRGMREEAEVQLALARSRESEFVRAATSLPPKVRQRWWRMRLRASELYVDHLGRRIEDASGRRVR